jgi:membrane protein YdbS with pleckstrin-like domain
VLNEVYEDVARRTTWRGLCVSEKIWLVNLAVAIGAMIAYFFFGGAAVYGFAAGVEFVVLMDIFIMIGLAHQRRRRNG